MSSASFCALQSVIKNPVPLGLGVAGFVANNANRGLSRRPIDAGIGTYWGATLGKDFIDCITVKNDKIEVRSVSKTPFSDNVAKQIATSQSSISPFKSVPTLSDPPIAATSTSQKTEATTPKTAAKKRPRQNTNTEWQTIPTTLETTTRPSRQQRRQNKRLNAFAQTSTPTYKPTTPTRTRHTTGRPTNQRMR